MSTNWNYTYLNQLYNISKTALLRFKKNIYFWKGYWLQKWCYLSVFSFFVSACAMKTLPCTERDVDVAIGYCLKYAPDRRGGGGRKTGNTGPEHEPEDEEPFRL